jgi:hypothetical protein
MTSTVREIRFRVKSKGSEKILSNMCRMGGSGMTMDIPGVGKKTGNTSEAFYQAFKALKRSQDPKLVSWVQDCWDDCFPVGKRGAAARFKNLINRKGARYTKEAVDQMNAKHPEAKPDLPSDEERRDIMRSVLKAKKEQCEEFRAFLEASKGCELIEDTSDPFWGRGKDGTGKNWLGKILMELREK